MVGSAVVGVVVGATVSAVVGVEVGDKVGDKAGVDYGDLLVGIEVGMVVDSIVSAEASEDTVKMFALAVAIRWPQDPSCGRIDVQPAVCGTRVARGDDLHELAGIDAALDACSGSGRGTSSSKTPKRIREPPI